MSLLGLYDDYSVQVENACLAMSVLEFLNIPLDGMKNFYWPCRMEKFIVSGVEIVIDGAHNGDSVSRLLTGLEKIYCRKDYHIMVLFGAGMDKSWDEMMSHLFQKSDSVLMIQARHFKSLSEEELIRNIPDSKQSILLQTCYDKFQSLSSVSKLPFSSLSPAFSRQLNGTIDERLQWAIDMARWVTKYY